MKKAESSLSRQQATIRKATRPSELVKLAPYKLAFIINKRKFPFNSCSAFAEFAANADPESVVFSRMPSSRDTITRRTQDIHSNVLRPNLLKEVSNAPYWGLILDDGTDNATKEQMGV